MYFKQVTAIILKKKNVTKLSFSETGGQMEELTRTQN